MEKIEIINTIIKKISEKYALSDLEIQEYKQKISDSIDVILKYYYISDNKEIKLKIVSNPHDYGKLIGEKKFKDNEGFTNEIYNVKNIIGNSTIGMRGYDKDIKANFSLGDIQITTMRVKKYSNQERDNEEIFDEIVVYIPEERYRQEDFNMTYNELLYNEKLKEIENKIKQNAQDLVNQIIKEISKSYKLPDALISEYKNKILESLKAESTEIEKIARRGFWSDFDDFNLIITKDVHEFGKEIQEGEYDFENSGKVVKVRNIIGDSTIKGTSESPDFSIGDIQICKRTKTHEYNNSSNEIIVYVPEKKINEELFKNPVKTYKELLDLEAEEKEKQIDKETKEYSIELAESLKKQTNGFLSREQIKTIIDKLDVRKMIEWDSAYRIKVISDLDEFSKYLIVDKDDDYDYETISIIGDTINRN